MKLGEVIETSTSDQKTCKQVNKHCSSCKTTINNLRPYIVMKVFTVNTVANNVHVHVVHVKQQ